MLKSPIKVTNQINSMIAEGIDIMKSNTDPVTVILVGGGSVLAPASLYGVKEVFNHTSHCCPIIILFALFDNF